jgi:hypothetical protein
MVRPSLEAVSGRVDVVFARATALALSASRTYRRDATSNDRPLDVKHFAISGARAMSKSFLAAMGLVVFCTGVCSGQDFIKNAFGLGKKAAPKSEPAPFAEERGVVPQEYLLTSKNGPYHIFVASYVGDKGADYALRLAKDLREKLGFEAYVHNYREKGEFFQPDEKQKAEMKKQFHGTLPRFAHFKSPPQDNWAVVVGNFAGIENDRAFDAAMKKLKRLNRESFSQPVAVELRWGTDANRKNPNELVGLRGTANPLRPREEKLSEGQLKTLKLIKEMNDPEPYSVYQLKKPYTMCVFKFSASVGIAKPEKKSFFGGKSNQSEGLAKAADTARVFCKAMRDMGYDAYIFHSDSASCVSVNGYEGKNDPEFVKDYQKFSKMTILGMKLEPDLIRSARDPASVLYGN